jgi:Rrf2 family protein
MRLLSDAGEYALRAVVWLAGQPRTAHKTREIAEATRAAPGYLVKVLQGLARAGILAGARGSAGGFTLLREPDDLSVLEVLSAVDPLERIRTCPLGLVGHEKRLCSMHQRLDDALAAVETLFSETTVGDLLRESSRPPALCALPAAKARTPRRRPRGARSRR